MNPFRSALIVAYAVGAMAFAVGWQLVEDTCREVAEGRRLMQQARGWWQ